MSAILAAWTVTICLSSCERDDAPLSENQGSGRTISFTAASSSEWPDITKSPINNVGDLLGDGFIVWGSWTKCPDDDSYWLGEYASGVNNAVFGLSGTEVIATDKNNDGKFDQARDTWVYTPERDWYKGYYTFAAAIPASGLLDYGIVATHTSDITFQNTTPVYINKLTLDFPDNSFDLSKAQIDLMTAFAIKDNSNENADQIKFHFDHICARLNISLAVFDSRGNANPLDIESVTVYGLLNSIASPLEFTQTTNNVTSRITASADRSTQADPFHVANKGWEILPSTLESLDAEALIQDLLVFPGALSEDNPLKLKIDYTNPDRITKSIYIKITQGQWEAGKSYSYTFQADMATLE